MHGCRMRIDLDLDIHTGIAGQGQSNKDQQDDQTASSVEDFSHNGIANNSGARLFHSTMAG